MKDLTNENGLPSNWATAKLGEICFTTSGGTPSRKVKKFFDGNIPWVKSGELKHNIILDTEEKISDEALDNSSAKIFPKGTLLIALYGATVGKLAFLGIEAASNQAVCGIYQNEIIELNLLYYFLFLQRQKLVEKSFGGAQPNISQTMLKELNIPLPPLPEQHRIVSKIEQLFTDLNKGIEQLEKAQQQLKVYRQSVLKWAFEGKLTRQHHRLVGLTDATDSKDNSENKISDSDKGELPKSWKLLMLKDLVKDKEGLRRGPFGSAIKKEYFVSDGYKVYEQGNAINDDPYRGKYFVDEKKYQELINFKVLPHDLIVSCSGVTLARISEIPEDGKAGIINQALLRIRLRKELISNKFFIIHFRAAFFQKKIFEQSQGTAMPNLVGIKDFKEIEMMIPPSEEQEKIVAEIESRLSVCDKIEETIENSLRQAEALRQSILKKAFEGKLVAQNPKDEPAEKLLERIRAEEIKLNGKPEKEIKTKKREKATRLKLK